MASTYTPLLQFVLPTTGENNGTWGDLVNVGLSQLIEDAIAGVTTLSADSDTTLSTANGAADQARMAIINCTGARTALRNITAPATSKAYTVINGTTGGFSVVIRGAGPTTGVTVLNGQKVAVAWNGTDFVKVASSTIALASDVTGTLPVANGGIGATTLTLNYVLLGNGTSAPQMIAPGTNGNVLTSNGTTWASSAPTASGTVTTVSVTTANGVSGSVATATTTPAISLTLGAITPSTVNGNTITTGTGVLTLGASKTLTVSNSITLAGTDTTTMTFPPASASLGYLNVPQNSQSSAYTTVLADAGKQIYHPSADTTARVWTIDSNANVAYPIGTTITFVNDTSAGVITIAITSDTLVWTGTGSTGSRSLAANGNATALKITSTRWQISGTGLT